MEEDERLARQLSGEVAQLDEAAQAARRQIEEDERLARPPSGLDATPPPACWRNPSGSIGGSAPAATPAPDPDVTPEPIAGGSTDEPRQILASGRYLDTFEKRSDEVRIAERFVVHDWFNENTAVGDWSVGPCSMVGLERGAQLAEDKSSTWLGMN